MGGGFVGVNKVYGKCVIIVFYQQGYCYIDDVVFVVWERLVIGEVDIGIVCVGNICQFVRVGWVAVFVLEVWCVDDNFLKSVQFVCDQ